MVTVPLVENTINNGRTLLGRLRHEGVDVRVACWVKPVEEARWTLYIATPSVDERGTLEAYRQMIAALRSLGNDWITSSDITLVGAKHPMVRDALDILRRFPHKEQSAPAWIEGRAPSMNRSLLNSSPARQSARAGVCAVAAVSAAAGRSKRS